MEEHLRATRDALVSSMFIDSGASEDEELEPLIRSPDCEQIHQTNAQRFEEFFYKKTPFYNSRALLTSYEEWQNNVRAAKLTSRSFK